MKAARRSLLLALVISLAGIELLGQPPVDDYFVYLGTYTDHGAKGIYAYRFQPSTGKLTSMGAVATTPNPSFLAVHPNGRFLYAANESNPAIPAGKDNYVSAFAINQATGQLTFLNNVSARGGWPCHVSIDKTASTLFAANY